MKAHRTDLVSLTFGLVFAGLATWWLLAQLLDLPLPALGWFLAGGLISVGLIGLVGALRSSAPASPDPATAIPDPGAGFGHPGDRGPDDPTEPAGETTQRIELADPPQR